MQFFREEKGNILVLAVAAILGSIICAALVVDIGAVLVAKNQLQSAVDASALAGGIGLIQNQQLAQTKALTIGNANNYLGNNANIQASEVTFPVVNRVRVQAQRRVPTYFAKIIGINFVNITSVAEAEIGTVIGTQGLKPWALPDMGWPTGTSVVIKSGVLGAPATNAGYFYPVDYPPINRGTPESGASVYEENIATNSDAYVQIGDLLQVEPGNMVGPTSAGVDVLITQDPDAYWNGSEVADSRFPQSMSPRVIVVPLYDPNFPPDSGKNTVEVIGLAAFFLEGVQGRDVTGVFMKKVDTGKLGNGYSFLEGVKLVR